MRFEQMVARGNTLVAKRVDDESLMAAIREYAAATRDRQTIAYVSIGGADGNMSPAHAQSIADLFAGLRIKLNLIDVTAVRGAVLNETSPSVSGAFSVSWSECPPWPGASV